MSNEHTERISREEMLRMTTDVVSAYVGNNTTATNQLPDLIKTVHGSLNALGEAQAAESAPKPAVPVRRSLTPEYLVCLEDGKKLKMLKRYLRTTYDMSPDDYRQKWGLPADYPMVAPNYAKRRSEFAKRIGLGRRGRGGQPEARVAN
ncbi:MAG: transcriptional regulator [Rhodospirillaceae bacterium]|nr:transcriptional regulator [Rhodospirillaceae bacterium]MYF87383.1 transcriptional regulator [Rhodospirillaceae bacterium]MYH35732.1 transcriptional regulator [Rhodospirillaceae bacterium]MYK15262.1 transcriptional regulator [Rhodospirillaceae bacterium]MYK59100.1 transcriptional regulator [Rhodospirillaceae bacterium]